MAKRQRPRTQRRIDQRAARERVRALSRLAAQAPGASADRPIDVTASSVIEGRARSTPCPLCEGTLHLDDHAAERELRILSLTCQRCGVSRKLWFRLVPAAN